MRTPLLLSSLLLAAPSATAQSRLALGPARTLPPPPRWSADVASWAAARYSPDGATLTVRSANQASEALLYDYDLATGAAAPVRVDRVAWTSPDGRHRLAFTPTASDARCRVDRVERRTGRSVPLGVYDASCDDVAQRGDPSFSDDGARVALVGELQGSPPGTAVTVFDGNTGREVGRSAYAMSVGGGADPSVALTPRGDGLVWTHGRVGSELLRLGADAVVYRGPNEGALSPTLAWRLELPHCPFAVDACSNRAVLRAVGRRGAHALGTAPPDSHPAASFSDDGALLATYLGSTLTLYAVGRGAPRRLTRTRAFRGVRSLVFAHDRSSLALLSAAGITVVPLELPGRRRGP